MSGNASARLSAPVAHARLTPASLVLWTILISGVLRLLAGVGIDYGYGEGYYVATARHLALSYFDQPPVSLWITWAMIKLAGAGAVLAVRLPFIAMFAVTTWLMFRLGERLFGAWAGAWAAVLLNLSLVFTVSIGSWVQPDGPLFLFLLAASLPLVDLIFGEPAHRMRLWAAAGAAFGLALISKYHAALTLCGLLIFVTTTPRHRAWFFDRGLAVAAVIAALIFSPVLIWNWQNDWASFLFQGDRVFGSSIRFDWLARSIAGQASLIGVVVWVPLMVSYFGALRRGPADARSWFLCCVAIVPIILFTVMALWAPLGWHFHWQTPGYVFLFPLLGKAVAERMERNDRVTRIWLWITSVGLVILVGLLVGQARYGWVRDLLPARFRAMPYQTTNPTRELTAWTGLREVLTQKGLLPSNGKLFAVVQHWTQVGKADAQIGDEVPVICLCGDPRNIAFGWDQRTFLGRDALIIFRAGDDFDPIAAYGQYFEAVEPLTRFDVTLGGEVAETIEVYRGTAYTHLYPLSLPPAQAGSATGQ